MDPPAPKRASVVSQDDVEMPKAHSSEHEAWKKGHKISFAVAVAFMSLDDRGMMVASYQTQLFQDAPSMAGVDRVLNWANPYSPRSW